MVARFLRSIPSPLPVALLVLGSMLPSATTALAQPGSGGPPGFFGFSPRLVCGMPGVEVQRRSLVSGSYATSIGVHNPFEDPVKLRWKVVQLETESSITGWTVVELGPDGGETIDCEDAYQALGTPPIVFWAGFVVVESVAELDVSAVYTSEERSVVEHQEILFRLVSYPYKVREVKRNGAGRDEPPPPGKPPAPGLGLRPELLSVDFEKEFATVNKIVYGFETPARTPGCPGERPCTGTREVMIPGPALEVPFPAATTTDTPTGGKTRGEASSLEALVTELDPTFTRIIDVEAVLFQTDRIKQEVTYRWVSDPVKIVLDELPEGFFLPVNVALDEDQDGAVDEELPDGIDNDGDGEVDEDLPLPAGIYVEILDVDLTVGVGKGHSEDVEIVPGKRIKAKPHPDIV